MLATRSICRFFFGIIFVLGFHSTSLAQVQDPNREGISVLGRVSEGPYKCTTIQGEVIFAVAGNTLKVFKETVPGLVQSCGFMDLPFVAWDMSVTGDVVVISDNTGQLLLVDIGQPETPVILNTLQFSSGLHVQALPDLVVHRGFHVIRLLDISNPEDPLVVSEIDFQGSVRNISAWDDLLIVGEFSGDISIYDISVPQTPVLLSSLYDDCQYLSLDDGVLVTANYSDGLKIYDLSQPQAPVFIGLFFPDANLGRIAIRNRLVLAAGDSLRAIDVSRLANPIVLDIEAMENVSDLAIGQNHASVAAGSNGFHIISLATLPSIVMAADFPAGISVIALAVHEDHLIVRSFSMLEIFDVSDWMAPSRVCHMEFPSTDLAMHVNWPYLFVSIGPDLEIFNIQDPANPVQVGSLPDAILGYATMAMEGDILFALNYPNALNAIDVGDPANPFVVGAPYDVGCCGVEIVIKEGISYHSTSCALETVNISDPANMTHLGWGSTGNGHGSGIDVSGRLAYLTTSEFDGPSDFKGLHVFDVVDPEQPNLVFQYESEENCGSVKVVGDYLLMGEGAAGLTLFDLSEPETPVLIERWEAPGLIRDIVVEEGVAFVGMGGAGVAIIGVPPGLSSVDGPGDSLPTPGMQLHFYPNPFNPRTIISFEIPNAGRVSLRIFDMRGRLVTSILDGIHMAGKYELEWDGRNDLGMDVSSGIYFAQLELEGKSVNGRMVLLR